MVTFRDVGRTTMTSPCGWAGMAGTSGADIESGRPAPDSGRGHEIRQTIGGHRRDIEGEALATLIVNHVRGTHRSLAVKAPGFGDRRKAMLADLAILTGCRVIGDEVGLMLEAVGLAMLGRAGKVVATKDDTTIMGGAHADRGPRRSAPDGD